YEQLRSKLPDALAGAVHAGILGNRIMDDVSAAVPCHTVMAATNKYLAQSNKSRTGGKATKRRRSLPAGKLIELIQENVDQSAPGTNNYKTAAIEAEAREDDKVKMAEFCAWWSE